MFLIRGIVRKKKAESWGEWRSKRRWQNKQKRRGRAERKKEKGVREHGRVRVDALWAFLAGADELVAQSRVGLEEVFEGPSHFGGSLLGGAVHVGEAAVVDGLGESNALLAEHVRFALRAFTNI